MRATRGHRMSRLGALASVALTLLVAFPATASAQVDDGGIVTGDKIDEAVDRTTDIVDRGGETVEGTVDGAAGSEGDTVDSTTDTIDRATDSAGQAVDDTVDDATDVTDDASKGRIGPLDRPVKNAVARVHGVVDSILGANGDTSGGRADADTSADADTFADADRGGATLGGLDGFVSAVDSVDPFVLGASFDRSETDSNTQIETPVAATPTQSLIQNIGDVLPKIAFPVALLILVAAFLVIQGRVDRSDPKLAAAPIDIDQEYLSFR